MPGGGAEDDPLSRWLSGAGLEALEGLSAGALDVIGIMDRALTVRYVNWATPGLERSAVVGHSVFNLVPPDHREFARRTYEDVLATGVGTRFETMYRGERGILQWEVRVGPIRFEGAV